MRNLSLRYKLMVITSGLIIVSLIVLSVISIRNFTTDKADFVKLQTNDTAKLIGDKLEQKSQQKSMQSRCLTVWRREHRRHSLLRGKKRATQHGSRWWRLQLRWN